MSEKLKPCSSCGANLYSTWNGMETVWVHLTPQCECKNTGKSVFRGTSTKIWNLEQDKEELGRELEGLVFENVELKQLNAELAEALEEAVKTFEHLIKIANVQTDVINPEFGQNFKIEDDVSILADICNEAGELKGLLARARLIRSTLSILKQL